MKKLLLSVLTITVFGFGTMAQVDQLTALKNIAEKTEFVAIKLDWGSDGKMYTYPQSKLRVLSYKNDDIGNTGSFYLNESYIARKDADPAQERPNHPSKPSIFYSTFTGTGSIIIGQMVYVLERNKLKNILDGDFKIAAFYEIKSQDKKEYKKQLKGRSTNLLTIDHNKVLKEYFAAMKKIQENASKNMSEADKEDAEATKRIQEEKEKSRMQVVANDWEKSHTKDGKEGANQIIIVNDTGHGVCVVQGGSSTTLSSGRNKFSCNDNIYYGVMKGSTCTTSKGNLLVGKDSCGKTITLE